MEEWARPDYTLSDAELLEKLKEEIGDRSTKKEAGIIRAHENYNLPRSTSRITGPESGNLRVVSSQPGSSNVGKGSSRGVISRWSSLSKGKKIGVGIGVGIAGIWAANRIFGKDDYYNTIEGLPELGMAAQQRHILTDFGSGYQGPNPWLSPEYNQAEETPHLELMRASQLGKSKSELVKYFTQKEHASEYLLATSSAGTALHLVEETKKQTAGQTSSVEQFVYDPVHRVTGHIDFTDPSGNPVDIKTLAPERMNRVKSWGAFPKHVSQLNFYMAQLGASEGTLEYINRENTESRKKIVVPFSQELLDADISRMESARAEVEAGISSGKWERSQLPRGASLETLREGANSEKAELERNAGRLGYLKDVYSQEMSYLHGLEGNRFSAKDDAFNTIEGLSHKGIAQKKRHELTEFGSGWMPNPMAVLETLDDIAYTARRAGYWTWGGLGQGISNTYSQFSGKDDEYNTIEGLKHGGWAQQKRRQMTDFGSGYQGDVRNASHSEYANHLVTERLDLKNNQQLYNELTLRPKFRGKKGIELAASSEEKNLWNKWANSFYAQHSASRVAQDNIQNYTSNIRSVEGQGWHFWEIGKEGLGKKSASGRAKLYASFENPIEELTSEKFNSLLVKLSEGGFQGGAKVPDAGIRGRLFWDNLVIHGRTKEDIGIAEDVVKNLFGEKATISFGTDPAKGGSYNQSLADKILETRKLGLSELTDLDSSPSLPSKIEPTLEKQLSQKLETNIPIKTSIFDKVLEKETNTIGTVSSSVGRKFPKEGKVGLAIGGVLLGAGILSLLSSRELPKEGRAFNPIEGLHPGAPDGALGKGILQKNTPFGSNVVRSKIASFFKNVFSKVPSLTLLASRNAAMEAGVTIERGVKGATPRTFFKEVFNKTSGEYTLGSHVVLPDERVTREIVEKQLLGRKTTNVEFGEMKEIIETHEINREASEIERILKIDPKATSKMMSRIRQIPGYKDARGVLNPLREIDIELKEVFGKRFTGGHISQVVPAKEAAEAAFSGNELRYNLIREFRLREAETLLAASPQHKYASRMKKMFQSLDTKRAQMQQSRAAISGGKGHLNMAGGRSVVELSPRHGGG